MSKQLLSRPHLDHLRRQAKSLLAGLHDNSPNAIKTFREWLPIAKGFTDDQMRSAGFRLADAQSAIARQSGFAGWPQLARHVDTLRALEGTWGFDSLEVDGHSIPPTTLKSSLIYMDGDRFRSESPGAVYEGYFNIDVEPIPHAIDIVFVEGPEAGNTNFGIFRLEGDRLEICLDVNGKPRPKIFKTASKSGHAFEVLSRISTVRPNGVDGGTKQIANQPNYEVETTAFALQESRMLALIQGEWIATELIAAGQPLPAMMLKTALRSVNGNQIQVRFGGKVMIDALMKIDESIEPVCIDYLNVDGPARGLIQTGIMRLDGNEICVNMAMPGEERPTTFECQAGTGQTYSRWKRKK